MTHNCTVIQSFGEKEYLKLGCLLLQSETYSQYKSFLKVKQSEVTEFSDAEKFAFTHIHRMFISISMLM